MSEPLSSLSPTRRFADRASDYALFRPSYPREAIDALLEGVKTADNLTAADIGAGTGISSRLLADRGVRVFAVEPNAAMRDGAEAHERVSFIDGTAEATSLPDGSVDIVLCAQAFHWFKPEAAIAEFRRILKANGRLALMINERDDGDPATRAYNAAIRNAAERELSEGMRDSIEAALVAAALPVNPRVFPYSQRLTRDGLVGRARSASYVPKEGPRYEQMLRDLEAMWSAYREPDGRISLGYRTFVWIVPRPV